MSRLVARTVLSCLVLVLSLTRVNGEIRTFRTPAISLSPGDVSNLIYRLEMPPGHLGVKSFNGEVVYEDGSPVLLSDLYLHHWVAYKVYARKHAPGFGNDYYVVPNDGICQGVTLSQFYGLGSETRRTDYFIPEPYVIEVGNPQKIPAQYEERWSLNVHAIDLRGTANPFHCLECRCASYNLSISEYGKKVPEEYVGGLECCTHGTHCEVVEGFEGEKKNYYFQYTIEFFPMGPSLKPVKVYIMDVTDERKSVLEEPVCKVEYDVLPGNDTKEGDIRESLGWLLEEKNTVDVVYVTGHLHASGRYIMLQGENGKDICKAEAIYGIGHEAGNETGNIVGMSSCYPEVGSVTIDHLETLYLKVVYDNENLHTGVMGLMYLLVADPVEKNGDTFSVWKLVFTVVLVALAVVVIGVSLTQYMKSKRRDGSYETLVEA